MAQKRICVGVILKPVGIKGQVKILSYTSSPENITKFPRLFLSDNTEIILKHSKFTEKNIILSFIEGYNDRTSVESLHSEKIYIFREDLKELEEDEYYFDDLRNLKVIDENNNHLGHVSAVFDYGAGTFLELMINGEIATLPFNKNSISKIDLKNHTMNIDSSFILN